VWLIDLSFIKKEFVINHFTKVSIGKVLGLLICFMGVAMVAKADTDSANEKASYCSLLGDMMAYIYIYMYAYIYIYICIYICIYADTDSAYEKVSYHSLLGDV
jgi:Co/Zn/Cd efflux system component